MEKIMIVEDEALTALNLKVNLQSLGFEIVAIESTGNGAIKSAKETKPDLILMDIALADSLNGIEASIEIKKDYDVPIIFLTAYNDEETINKAKMAEPYGYIVKPIDLRTLKTTIDVTLYKNRIYKKLKDTEEELRAKNELLEGINKDLQHIAIEQHKISLEKEKMLIQQSKLASLGEVLGAISHQWRQPLNAIAILVQSLEDIELENEENKNKIKSIIEETMKQVNFMSTTIEDFKSFLKPSNLVSTFSIKQAINHITNLLQTTLINANIVINFQCSEDVKIRGKVNEFKHVILNLINNAKDAINEARKQGKLDKTSQGEIDINVTVGKNSKTIISIKDNGKGIPEEILPKIFECYFSTKHENEGTGIGLYMVKKIVEEHMLGVIYARNTNNGAEFVIEL
ncbi:MAG: response regulator [Thermodesulfovibrionales bacterium]|nr:response regulator [Thermodesulfovibrionales bacterium]